MVINIILNNLIFFIGGKDTKEDSSYVAGKEETAGYKFQSQLLIMRSKINYFS